MWVPLFISTPPQANVSLTKGHLHRQLQPLLPLDLLHHLLHITSADYHHFLLWGNVCFFLLFRPVLATYGAFLPWGAVASLFFPCFCSPSWLLPCSPVLLFSVHHEPYNHHFTTKRLMGIFFLFSSWELLYWNKDWCWLAGSNLPRHHMQLQKMAELGNCL